MQARFAFLVPVTVLSNLLLLCVLLVEKSAHAQLTINLAPAQGISIVSESERGQIESLFSSEAENLASVLEDLPDHVKAWPGMMVVKVGSLWASVSIIFPDQRSTRIIHLGAVVRPFGDWAASNQLAYTFASGTGGIGSADTYFLLAKSEQTLGDPFEKKPRGFHDDRNRQMPTLLELRMPLDANSLVNVLTERAELQREFSLAGNSGPCGWEKTAGASCTLGPILKRLVTAAYGSVWTPNPEAVTPLGLGLDLARVHGPKSLQANGCPVVESRRIADNESLDQSAWVPATVGLMDLLDISPRRMSDDAIDSATLLRDYPDLVELALGGVQDPAGLSLIDCALRREILHGETHPLPNIILRSRWYDRACDLINEHVKKRPDSRDSGVPEILFFDAASHVTRTLGVGLVELIERNPNTADALNLFLATREWPKTVVAQERLLQVLGILTEDADIDQTELPKTPARALLRDLNLLLFRNNRQVIREVIARLEHSSDGASRFPDPAVSPGAGTLRHGLMFDLRMVLFEQGLIEAALVEHRKQSGYSQTVNEIDSAARLQQGLRVMAGYHRSAWIDRVVYGAVGIAEEMIAAENRYLRIDGQPLYASRGEMSVSAVHVVG